MRVLCSKCRAAVKFISLWFFAVFVITAVLSCCRKRAGEDTARENPIEDSNIAGQAKTKLTADLDLDLELQKRQQKLNEDRLQKLQLFPKIEQVRLLEAALANRPELKNFLKERFNISGNGIEMKPEQPAPRGNAAQSSEKPAPKQRVNYLMDLSDKCSRYGPFALILVHSHWNNRDQRRLIRSTWARIASYKNHTVSTVFLLGRPGVQQRDGGSRRTAEQEIYKEQQEYDDLVQGDFVDEYRNLTIKHLMGYRWALDHCPGTDFIVKTDDDVIVNTFELVDFLASTENALRRRRSSFYCSAFVNQGPRRDEQDKWFVSRSEYSDDKYPTYCEGFAYVTTPEAVARIYRVSRVTPTFWIDDVFVTGILARITDVGHVQFQQPHGYATVDQGRPANNLRNVLFFLQKYIKNGDAWLAIWNQISEKHKPGTYRVNDRYIKPALPHSML